MDDSWRLLELQPKVIMSRRLSCFSFFVCVCVCACAYVEQPDLKRWKTSTLFGKEGEEHQIQCGSIKVGCGKGSIEECRGVCQEVVVAEVPSALLKIASSSFNVMLHVCDCSLCTVVRVPVTGDNDLGSAGQEVYLVHLPGKT